MNARLGTLQARLREFSMIDFSKIPRDRVGLGSQVVVLDLDKDEEITYQSGHQRRSGRRERQDLHQFAQSAAACWESRSAIR